MPEPVASDTASASTSDPELIRRELQNILAGKPFATAARSRRFLTYVTEKTLAGQHDEIKELIVGMEVFDRANDFDPRADTIVRVEAGKLRKRLQEYYETEGAGAKVRIEIPKGTYVPQFHRHEAPGPHSPVEAARWPRKYIAAGLLIALILVAAAAYWGTRTRPTELSIAVLPFLNLSSDASNEYFADGLAEDLTDALARLGGLRVASRTSAFFFKGKQTDIHDVGARLHAAFVVEGSVRKEGQRIKISAQLVRTDDGYHVWSNSFERDMKDVFAVQQEIARSVASTLKLRLIGGKREQLAKPYTASVEAFDLYMRGRHAAAAGILADINPAERLFQQAIAADPAYPLPYVALADLYLHADILELRPTGELVGKAKEAISKALALDGAIAEAHAILGSLTARHEYNWIAAERHIRDALDLDPNSAAAHNLLAQDILAPQARWQEAMAENRQAMELDPFSSIIAVGQPWLQYLQHHYDPAIQGFRGVAATHGFNPATLHFEAVSKLGKGDYETALGMFEGMIRQGGSMPALLAITGYAHGRAGHTAEAKKILQELEIQSRSRFVSLAGFATIYVGLNDREKAFEYLERARQDHESFLIFSRVDGLFDPIRSDPRFATLLNEIGLSDKALLKNHTVTSDVHR
jgi:TolB-like protein